MKDNQHQENMNNPENKRPNEHRAGLVDQSVINFLGAKGGSCCQAEACDGGSYVNENLKKDLFTSEEEGKDFKESGVLPLKHRVNGAKLNEQEQAEIEKECGNNSQQQGYLEKLLTYTLKKVAQKNHF